MSEPLVGLVTPVRNAEAWLDEMLSSVRAQTYANWRLLVVDDGSTDRSPEIAERHAEADPRIEVIRRGGGGSGAPAARAFGRARLADSPALLYFPDADDILEPELLATLVRRLSEDPSAVAVFCRYLRIDAAGVPVAESPPQRIALSRRWVRRLPDGEPVTPFESIYGWAAPAMEPVTLFRAAAYDRAGGWEGWPVQGGESVDLLCRMMRDGPVLFEPEPLYRYRRHASQHSSDQAQHAAAALAIRTAWRERAARDDSIRAAVDQAEFFTDHRLAPYKGIGSALQRARVGDLAGAVRFLAGAVRRYRWKPL